MSKATSKFGYFIRLTKTVFEKRLIRHFKLNYDDFRTKWVYDE